MSQIDFAPFSPTPWIIGNIYEYQMFLEKYMLDMNQTFWWPMTRFLNNFLAKMTSKKA